MTGVKITSEELASEVSRITSSREDVDMDELFGERVNLSTALHNRFVKKNPDCKAFSKYKGVHKDKKKWRSRIYYNRRQISLGSFDKEIDAAKAYDDAARKIYKKFAVCNFEEIKK